ncbi:hypothetical protein JANAI62_04950 [Jannaschia pagri]|uniref:DUF1127 domain-containing protein n=1 Tax=Jannaschia pagri TaxID=2829797 RepID=A0ABQ4NHJ0_9RHOB|nr:MULTISPECIES: hypothetical protein [unclassified Jannaschia]GIT90022.1 hypothetical protein JANAI61_04800 [Jannaschia sp. AI_61]GIT93872.1 hypothetical protein JANAI62_04950 [Jannaschia sp. AI_62]
MNVIHLPPRNRRDPLDAAIALHGPRYVLMAAMRAMLRPRARPPDTTPPVKVDHISDHIRRDIGLMPRGPAPDWTRHPF